MQDNVVFFRILLKRNIFLFGGWYIVLLYIVIIYQRELKQLQNRLLTNHRIFTDIYLNNIHDQTALRANLSQDEINEFNNIFRSHNMTPVAILTPLVSTQNTPIVSAQNSNQNTPRIIRPTQAQAQESQTILLGPPPPTPPPPPPYNTFNPTDIPVNID